MDPRRSIQVGVLTRSRSLALAVSSSSSSPSPLPRQQHRSPGAPPRRKSVEAYAEEWAKEKAASGAPPEDCVLPFLQGGAPRMVECLTCSRSIVPDERIQCSVQGCEVTLHEACFRKRDGCCPRHICSNCLTVSHSEKCTVPMCSKCLLQQNMKADSVDPSNTLISWSSWPLTSEDAGPTNNIEEAFRRLPLPCTDQEFSIYPVTKKELENGTEPPPYIRLKCNIPISLMNYDFYRVKNKSESASTEGGCIDCGPSLTCKIGCLCRSALVSCSRACHCSDKCTNKPFRKEKQIKIVKTQHCGWGAIALETIEKDDFVMEFIGEVIDDVTCEERLKDMKKRGDNHFYMCKVSKDFVIDATYRGNDCRFVNHSCEPNCELQKWQVKGEGRLGLFASQTIEVGEPLTYDYRFEQHFGPQKVCLCGAVNCRGYL